MVKSAETATRNYASSALAAFLEGKKDLKWLLGVVRSSGVRGRRLAEVFEIHQDYGNRRCYEEALVACRDLLEAVAD